MTKFRAPLSANTVSENYRFRFSARAALGNLFSISPLSFLAGTNRAVRAIPCTLALGAALVFAFTPVKADAFDWLLENSLTTMSSCGSAFEGEMSSGTDCLLDGGANLLLKKGMDSANKFGKIAFGEDFQFFGDLSHQSGVGFMNNLDVVVPLAFTDKDRRTRSSLFLQQGITRWRDSEGDVRDDFRIGMAYRFRLTDEPDADVVGMSAFSMHSAEWGHQVLASRVDYAGRWGMGSLTYFLPVTDWRPAEHGFEERALEGMELGLDLKLTTTVRANLTAYRWQAEDGSDKWEEGARFGIDWRPHSWLNFSAGYDGLGGGKSSSSFLAKVSVPIGGPSRPKPRWEGLGSLPEKRAPGVFDLWRPIEKISRIKIARRIRTSDLSSLVSARPLQSSVISGELLQVRLSLPVTATEDVRVNVRLAPGTGDNPAVAGKDFRDEIIPATIRQGERDTVVSIPLIHNGGMRKPRSLKIITTPRKSSPEDFF